LQRVHLISNQGKPPFTAWSMVGDGSIGSPDLNRHLVKNTPYADWYTKLARSDHGGS
jgi:hypothetical protein